MSQLLHLTATTMCRNSKQVNTPPLGYSVRGKRHNASRKCLHAWADRRGSTHWVSQQQRLEYEPIHHDSTQWLIHALNHIITQFGSTINVLINLKGPKVYVILVILIGASHTAAFIIVLFTSAELLHRVDVASTRYITGITF